MITRFLLLFLVFMAMSLRVYGQDRTYIDIDSLRSINLSAIPDTSAVLILLKCGYYFESKEINIDSSYNYYKEAQDRATALGNENLIMRSRMALGSIYHDMGKTDMALKSFDSAYELAIKQNHQNFQMRILNNKGLVLDQLGRYSEALDIYRRLLDLGNKLKHEKVKATASVNISMAMVSLNRWEEGLIASNQAINICKESNDEFGQSIAYNNLSICHRNLGQYDKSLESIRISKKYADKSNNLNQQGSFYSNISTTFSKIGEIDSAILYAHQGILFTESNDLGYGKVKNYWSLAQAYLVKGNYDIAQENSIKSLNLAKEINSYEDVYHNIELQLRIAIERNDKEQSKALLDSTLLWKDHLFNKQLSIDLAETESKYKNEKLKNELLVKDQSLQEAQRKKAQAIFIASILGLAFSMFSILYYLWHKYQIGQNELKLQESFSKKMINEIDDFRKQVSQVLHDEIGQELLQIRQKLNTIGNLSDIEKLIVNILNQVRSLSRDQYPYQIDYIGFNDSLSELLDKMEKNTLLNIIEDNHLPTNTLKDNQEKHLFYIIQELLSNTVKHSQATKVKISVTADNDKVYVKYSDNGEGYDYENALAKPKHLGLKLILQRLKILHGSIRYKTNKEGMNECIITIQKNVSESEEE